MIFINNKDHLINKKSNFYKTKNESIKNNLQGNPLIT